MSNYAQVINGVVVNAIVADADFIESLPNKSEYKILTCGGIGWIFDGTNFIEPKPYPSWILDSELVWQPPTPKPDNGKRSAWFEPNRVWVEITI